jgi:hypothetical protein
MWNRKSPSAKSIPSWKELKAECLADECGMKVKGPKAD